MSASLVGSEMCIRDRRPQRRLALSRGSLEGRPCRAVDPIELRRALPLPAVSYTHLTLPTICSV
eukprot:14338920-Alexandrium_andersonii.AAC.1